MMGVHLIVWTCLFSLAGIQLCQAQENDAKQVKKPNKFFKSNQFRHKTTYSSYSETNDADMGNPFVPPPLPNPEESPAASPSFADPNNAGEFNTPGGDANLDPGRAQRFIGPNTIDPYFYINPINPFPRRQIPYHRYYPYELFMVVTPKQCSDNSSTTGNATDVAIKFLTSTSTNEPSRCSYAIASCCAPSNYHVRYACFEMMGCYGAFWDVNPCLDTIVSTAINELATFYSGASQDNTTTTTTAVPESPAPPAEEPSAAPPAPAES